MMMSGVLRLRNGQHRTAAAGLAIDDWNLVLGLKPYAGLRPVWTRLA